MEIILNLNHEIPHKEIFYITKNDWLRAPGHGLIQLHEIDGITYHGTKKAVVHTKDPEVFVEIFGEIQVKNINKITKFIWK